MIPLDLHFTICWAVSVEGNPTLDYLTELRDTDEDAFFSVIDVIEKIQDSQYLRPPLVKPLPINKKVKDMLELKVDSQRIFSRIAMIYTSKREVVLLNGISKKRNRADKHFINKAISLRKQLINEEIEYEEIPIKYIRESL